MWNLVNYLTFGGFTLGEEYIPAQIEELLGPQKYDEQIESLNAQAATLKRKLTGRRTAMKNLWRMLEDEDFDRDLFKEQAGIIQDEIQTIEAKILETEQKIDELKQDKASHMELIHFIRGNSEWLQGLNSQIAALAPQDKQALLESMLGGKIELEATSEINAPPHNAKKVKYLMQEPRFIFNSSALEALSEQGKLSLIYDHKSCSGRRPQGRHRL